MAKLTALPSLDIVDGFKGVIDFYIHRGIPCARSWPKTHWESFTPAARSAAVVFTSYSKRLSNAAPEVRAAAKAMAMDGPMTWKDVMTSIIYGLVYTE